MTLRVLCVGTYLIVLRIEVTSNVFSLKRRIKIAVTTSKAMCRSRLHSDQLKVAADWLLAPVGYYLKDGQSIYLQKW